ncbi:NCS1 family nucleobase:cation symporter-1 [Pseudomonas alcaligenes]|nr:NCS1 family nucleobase:cation symporter-1 [Pseudomonas alcaligenes]
MTDTVRTLESSTIQPIPLDQRHGSARSLFTLWFGCNLILLTVVTGGLAVTVFGLPFFSAVAALVVGNLVGGVFMALHAAQGPQLGVPQMVQTRGQFGSFGSLLVVGLMVVMYLGFFASNLVLGGQSLSSRFPMLSPGMGIVLIGVISLTAAAFGYRLIHAYTGLMTFLSGGVLILAFAWILFVHGLPEDFLQRNRTTPAGLLGTLSVAALWQLAYAPYVSDYSRYLPADTGARRAFWSSYLGCCLGTLLPMLMGVVVGLSIQGDDLIAGLVVMTGGLSTLLVTVLSIGIAATNSLNLYCGALSTITVGQTLVPRWSAGAGSRVLIASALFALALAIALLGQDDFLANYTSFILLLLYVLVPWSAINLVDYYLIAHGRYDVASFFRRDGGIYGRFNWVAVNCYALGILVQVPFMSSGLYTGPMARAMGGADISWLVGLLVVAPVYYLFSRRGAATRLARTRPDRGAAR